MEQILKIGDKVFPKEQIEKNFPFDTHPFAFVHSLVTINGRNYRRFGGVCKYRYRDTTTPFQAVGMVLKQGDSYCCIYAPVDLLKTN